MTDLLAPTPQTAEFKRDRWGRALIVPPGGGKRRSYMRVTTLASALEDQFNLMAWNMRMVLLGASKRPDLLALAAAADPKADDHKDTLNGLCNQLKDAAAADHGANVGTALHAATQRFDMGQDVIMPAPYDADVVAYADAMRDAGIERHAEWIERSVVLDDIEVAGTFDRLVHLPGYGWVVADLKTGQTLDFGTPKIAMQIACYANATALYDPGTDQRIPMPEVNREVGMVIHLPSGVGRCDLWLIDIEAGWKKIPVALEVRKWRNRKDLLTKYVAASAAPLSLPADTPQQAGRAPLPPESHVMPSAPPAGTPVELPRVEWIAQRNAALPPAGIQLLLVRWPAEVRAPKAMRAVPHRDYTDDEIAAIDAVLMPIEREYEIPFGPADPCAAPPAAGAGAPLEKRQAAAAKAAQDVDAGEASSGDTEVTPTQAVKGTSPASAPYCPTCDHGGHVCPGCGTSVPHGTVACTTCSQPDEGETVGDEEIDAMLAAHDRLTDAARLQSRAWLTEMAAAGTPLGLTKVRSRRRWCLARVVHAWAGCDDELLRAGLTVVLGDEAQESITTGVALLALSIDEATRLADLARALEAGSLRASYDGDVCSLVAAS